MGYSDISKEIIQKIQETWGEDSKKELLLSRIKYYDQNDTLIFIKDILQKLDITLDKSDGELSNIGFRILQEFKIPNRPKFFKAFCQEHGFVQDSQH